LTIDAENPDELLDRMKQGDDKALAELFSEHKERLARVIRFRLDPRLARRLDTEDILQEVYLNAAQRVQSFLSSPTLTFFVWLRLVASQTLADVHRRHLGAQARDACRDVSIHVYAYSSQATSTCIAIELAGNQASPSEAAIRREMSDQLERAIESMDPIDREILALRHFEELTNGEVAQVLGIQQKAASIRYVRALSRLRKLLAQLSDFAVEDRIKPAASPQGKGGGA